MTERLSTVAGQTSVIAVSDKPWRNDQAVTWYRVRRWSLSSLRPEAGYGTRTTGYMTMPTLVAGIVMLS